MPGPAKEGYVRLTLDIPEVMKEALVEKAASKDLSVSQYVRGVLSIALDTPATIKETT